MYNSSCYSSRVSHGYELFLSIRSFGFEDATYCILLKEYEVGTEGQNHRTIQSEQQEERRMTVIIVWVGDLYNPTTKSCPDFP